MWHPDRSCSNYSAPENWRCASRRLSDVPENAGTAPGISGYGFSSSLCYRQKQYAVLHRPVPETGRSPEAPASLCLQLPRNFVCIPDSTAKLPPVSSGTFFPISLRIFMVFWVSRHIDYTMDYGLFGVRFLFSGIKMEPLLHR